MLDTSVPLGCCFVCYTRVAIIKTEKQIKTHFSVVELTKPDR